MSSSISINLAGMSELTHAFDRVRDSVSTRDVTRVLKRAARPIRKAGRSNSPVGPTGNLKRSIKTKVLRRGAVTVRSDFRVAPHAHLVIRGTGERFRKRASVQLGALSFAVRGASTGAMPANDFMARAERSSGDRAQRLMASGLWELIRSASR